MLKVRDAAIILIRQRMSWFQWRAQSIRVNRINAACPAETEVACI